MHTRLGGSRYREVTALNPQSALARVAPIVFILSGASALMFETVWFRVTSIVLGSSVWSAAAVLMAFMAGLALVLPLNIWNYVVQEPNIGKFGHRIILQGGTQKNLAAVKSQVDHIKSKVPQAVINVHKYFPLKIFEGLIAI